MSSRKQTMSSSATARTAKAGGRSFSLTIVFLLLFVFPAKAVAFPNLPAKSPRSICPDLLAKDLVASRTSRQPEGASQSGSPWLPLEALLLRTTAERRDFMLRSIREQLESRHSTFNLRELDRVLAVMGEIDREKFLPPAQRAAAYLPLSVDIGFCQTLSDAYIVALMIAAAHIEPNDNVLDVGTGTGYQAAILSRLARHVQSLEIVPQLAIQARRRLKRMGYRNVTVAMADGYAGWPQLAPFDVILVTAGSNVIPRPLLEQLRPGGRLIMPIGAAPLEEKLVLAAKSKTGAVTRCSLGLAAFVAMTGRAQSTTQAFAKRPTSTDARGLPLCYGTPVT